MPAKGGRDVPSTTKLPKASNALTLEALGFGDSSAHSPPVSSCKEEVDASSARKRHRCSRWMLGSHWDQGDAGCEAEGLGGVTLEQPRAGLLQVRRQRFYFFFLASWFLMEAVREDGKKQNRLQYRG